MIPLWKVQREFGRLRQQLMAVPEAIWEPRAARLHDLAFASGFPITVGDVPYLERVALILTYQTGELPNSLLKMCEHLRKNGFSPLIICNAPVTAAQSDALRPVAWRILQRPNFGYDFGGYRDGLRYLSSQGAHPHECLIINDSIWWPLRDSDTLLDRLRASESGIAGTVLRDRDGERFLESYCYLIQGSVLQAPAFVRYWQNLALTSNKYKVIRRGERGFSSAMLAAGLGIRGVFETSQFLLIFAEQPTEFMRNTLAYAAYTERSDASTGAALRQRPDDKNWRADCIAHVTKTLQKGQCYSAFPYASLRLQDYPVLKKSNDRVSQHWRQAVLRAIDDGMVAPFSDDVMVELRAKQLKEGAV